MGPEKSTASMPSSRAALTYWALAPGAGSHSVRDWRVAGDDFECLAPGVGCVQQRDQHGRDILAGDAAMVHSSVFLSSMWGRSVLDVGTDKKLAAVLGASECSRSQRVMAGR